ncbi:RRQRL motif-containing zinc-binding protein [Nonomuraea ceibae]|uniref:RRQRL motif-containing zinc-binding protein n=1 Tax=Nonomuraea ceibae TaxID=1935170 RepID=UPI001C5FBC6D|nr:RRQRL motif-containing zinc-binding protein [Nonomuraea ceibae]
MAKFRLKYHDPEGSEWGMPTYGWRMAPGHLKTMRQLAAAGLRPGGQGVQAQILWGVRRVRAAYLYDVRLAKPKRVPTERQLEALSKALAARRTCAECGRDAGYVLPRCYGMCLDCAEDRGLISA